MALRTTLRKCNGRIFMSEVVIAVSGLVGVAADLHLSAQVVVP